MTYTCYRYRNLKYSYLITCENFNVVDEISNHKVSLDQSFNCPVTVAGKCYNFLTLIIS